MKPTGATTRTDHTALPQELASAVNLLAHPVAGAAAAGAVGFGIAGHVLGLWMGTLAGVAEASRKIVSGETEAQPVRPERGAALKLVVSKPPRSKAGTKSMSATPAASKTTPGAKGKPAGIDRPASPDDLKAISGIGPKLEKVLNDLGIWTYPQIAAFEPSQIAWLDDHLGFAGRIDRDDWRGQAGVLSGTRR